MKKVTSIIGTTLGIVLGFFLEAWVINKAIAVLIAVGLTLPTFTYWQMFFLLWGIEIVCRTLGKIFHSEEKIKIDIDNE